MNTVTLPDGRKIQFPADMNPEQMNAEIEKFLSAESAKAPAAQSLPMQAFNTVRSGFDAVGEAAQSIASMVQGGGTDERFKDTPGFSGEGLGQVPGMPNTVQGAKIVALDDTRYGEIIESALKERGLLVSAENDSKGNRVIRYRGSDDKTRETFINKPGLDFQDVDRFIGQSLPFMAAGGVVGAAAKGFSWGANALLQGLAAANVSITDDIAAQVLGSKQDVDIKRAAAIGLMGGLGEIAAAGLAKKFAPDDLFDEATGMLTEKGLKKARDDGLSAEDISSLETLMAEKGGSLRGVKDMGEANRQAIADDLGVPLTNAQRTKDINKTALEESIFKGSSGGEEGTKALREFKLETQPEAISKAATTIDDTLAPKVPATANPGESIQAGIENASQTLRAAESAGWDGVPAVRARRLFLEGDESQGIPGLQSFLNRNIGDQADEILLSEPGRTGVPAAQEAIAFLSKVIDGTPVEAKAALKGSSGDRTIDSIRRSLIAYRNSAKTPADKRATSKIMDGYLEWAEDMGKRLVFENPAIGRAVDKMNSAVKFSADVNGLLRAGSTSDKAGKLIQRAADAGDPQELLNILIGDPTGKIRSGSLGAMKRVKELMKRGGQSDAWDSVRLAWWQRVIQDKQFLRDPESRAFGAFKLKTPKKAQKAYAAAKSEQRAIYDLLYSEPEKQLMDRFVKVMEAVDVEVYNPSGSGHYIQKFMSGIFGDNVAKKAVRNFLKGRGTREKMLRGRPLRGSLYNAAADIPIVRAGAKGLSKGVVSRRVIGKQQPGRVNESSNGIPAVIGSQILGKDTSDDSPNTRRPLGNRVLN